MQITQVSNNHVILIMEVHYLSVSPVFKLLIELAPGAFSYRGDSWSEIGRDVLQNRAPQQTRPFPYWLLNFPAGLKSRKSVAQTTADLIFFLA